MAEAHYGYEDAFDSEQLFTVHDTLLRWPSTVTMVTKTPSTVDSETTMVSKTPLAITVSS